MRCKLVALGFHTFRHRRPAEHGLCGRPAVVVLALATWASAVLCGSQQACWSAEPQTAIAAKPPEKKPEKSPPAQDSSQRPAPPMSPEEIFAHASPAVVTLKIYNHLHGKAIFSGSGFIVADRFAKPFQVNADAKWFAADHMDCDDAEEFYTTPASRARPKSNNVLCLPKHEAFRKARRQSSIRDLPNLRQVFIVTNYHVIESAVSIHVQMHDGSTGFVSQVIQEDDSADVAILLAWFPARNDRRQSPCPPSRQTSEPRSM